MDKEELKKRVSEVRAEWEGIIKELGSEGLEQPNASGTWRVRDVLAHFNGWDRWQMVQLRSAFTGETPTDEELAGGIEFPPNDDMSEDAMNAMFEEGNRNRPLDDVVADWREISDMRADWIANATQEQLDAVIGSHWAGGTNRIFRLQSEEPAVTHPENVWMRLLDHVEHQKAHLGPVREWINTSN